MTAIGIPTTVTTSSPVTTITRNHAQASESALGRVVTSIGAIQIESPVRRRSGEQFDFGQMQKIATWARERRIGLHLDGARLFIESAYTKKPVKEYAALFDTVARPDAALLGQQKLDIQNQKITPELIESVTKDIKGPYREQLRAALARHMGKTWKEAVDYWSQNAAKESGKK